MRVSYGAHWRARGNHFSRATPRPARRAARARAFGCHCSNVLLSLSHGPPTNPFSCTYVHQNSPNDYNRKTFNEYCYAL